MRWSPNVDRQFVDKLKYCSHSICALVDRTKNDCWFVDTDKKNPSVDKNTTINSIKPVQLTSNSTKPTTNSTKPVQYSDRIKDTATYLSLNLLLVLFHGKNKLLTVNKWVGVVLLSFPSSAHPNPSRISLSNLTLVKLEVCLSSV